MLTQFKPTVLLLSLRVLLLASLLLAPEITAQIFADSGQLAVSSASHAAAPACSPSAAKGSNPASCIFPTHHCCLPPGEDAVWMAGRSAFAAATRSFGLHAHDLRRGHGRLGLLEALAFSARAPPTLFS